MSLSKNLFNFLRSKGFTINGFEKKVGVSTGLFARAIKNNSDIGSGKLMDIYIAFPDINLHWLLTGEGFMLTGKSGSNLSSGKTESMVAGEGRSEYGEDYGGLREEIEKLNSTIVWLAKRNNALELEIERLNRATGEGGK